ncbi:MAG: hypothetical protein RIS35_2661 [Pseudomonadota bacterium]|jgi:1-hydroxycarotenoid 3,4-desaturase
MGDARIAVIGAGIGGLSAALSLALKGHAVTLVEAGESPGGKMRQLQVEGAAIDAGPTVFTMRWVFEELLADAGISLDALVKTTPLSVLARHAWRGCDAHLDLHADRQRSFEAISAFSSPQEGRRYLAFCDEAQRVYDRLEGPHIRSQRPGFWRMVADLGPGGLGTLAGLGPFASLWRSLGRHFTDPRLRQLFARYATYCGASPWAAPATLMLVAHVEQAGVWSIDGGMHALARAMADLTARRGVNIRYGQRCERILIEKGRVAALQLESGERLPVDALIFNGDADALARGLLGPEAMRAQPRRTLPEGRSLSAVTWAIHARADGMPLARHNVFFDDDYASEFDDVMRLRRLPRQGTVYLCAQDRLDGDATEAPEGSERLLALVNAPADGDRRTFDATEIDPCEHRSLALLKHCGLNLSIERSSQVQRCTPTGFERLFPGSGGALYGAATHGWMALFRRPAATTPVPGLFLAGGSVHPGPGVPMAAMSGRLAAAALTAHLDSTHRWRRAATAGGTSTRSATTAATP